MSMQKRVRGVAMAEILVVLFIIMIIMALLMPALAGVRYLSRQTLCTNNMGQLAYGFLDYANAHKQRLVGNCCIPVTNQASPNFTPLDQYSWLYVSATNDYTTTPSTGTLFDFVRNKNMYLCPILPKGPYIGSGIGSNGLFTYVEYNSFYGARVDMIRLTARFYYRQPSDTTNSNPAGSNTMNTAKYDTRVTPIMVEEDPAHNLNVGNIDADHSNYDVMGNWHQQNPSPHLGAHANYAAIDGSVQFFERNDDYQLADMVWSLTPGNLVRQVGKVGPAAYALWDFAITTYTGGVGGGGNISVPVW